jgi:hypothetical protein
MRIAQLRPRRFSSTTVALASCSSDHFPKRPIYISDVRENDLPRGPGSILSRNVSGPRCAPHSLHRMCGLKGPASAGPPPLAPWIGSSGEGITVPCSDAGTLATTRHSMGGRASTRQREPVCLGPTCFISTNPYDEPMQRTDDQRELRAPWIGRPCMEAAGQHCIAGPAKRRLR